MKLYKISRMAPVSINDLPGIQGWLQSMATQGFRLDCCSNGTFYFNHEEPVQRRYRIDPSKGSIVGVATPQLQDMYREFGWTYVDSYTRYHHVFYTDDPNAVEPFTTPEVLAEKLERVKQRRLLFQIPMKLLLLLGLLYLCAHSTIPLPQKMIHVTLFIAGCYSLYGDIKPLLKLKQSSESETLLQPRTPEGTDRTLRCMRICTGIFLIWLILSRIF